MTIREYWTIVGTSKVEGKGYAISKGQHHEPGLPILKRVHAASLDLLSTVLMRGKRLKENKQEELR